jgi:outer membrane protein assembly factor BamB
MVITAFPRVGGELPMAGPLYLSASRATGARDDASGNWTWRVDPPCTVALDDSTGTELWRVDTPLSSLAVDRTSIYGTGPSGTDLAGRLCALDPADGARRWGFAEPLRDDYYAKALFLPTPDVVYCITAANEIVALRVADGVARWRHGADTWDASSFFGVGDGQLFVRCYERIADVLRRDRGQQVRALDTRDGAERWCHEWQGEYDGSGPLTPPALDGATLYVCVDEDTVVALAHSSHRARLTSPLCRRIPTMRSWRRSPRATDARSGDARRARRTMRYAAGVGATPSTPSSTGRSPRSRPPTARRSGPTR